MALYPRQGPERRDFTGSKELARILTAEHPLARTGGKVVAKQNNTAAEQPKEKKTKRELEAMARQRLGCAVPVRRDVKGAGIFR
jgi:hypothetical protein